MQNKASHILWFLLVILSLIICGAASQSQDDTKSYIVYLGDLPKGDIESPTSIHKALLQQVTSRNSVSKHLVRSFTRSFSGFVVDLTEEEMRKMTAMEGVVSVFPNEKMELHTTRSWDFLNFPETVKRATIESDIIVGVIDSGITPESKSFDDTGYGPKPTKWKGVCQSSATFKCNNKLIGAKYYRTNLTYVPGDLKSPRDSSGHGTHVASTAAGSLVNKASLFGLGSGTARGGVPAARVAAYKVCWSDGCDDSDIMAAFDDAIADGVDIISLSVGGKFAKSYFRDSIAIGSFHAMKSGILTSTSAGNNGPKLATTAKVAPWALSVAASTTDRRFFTKAKLGNGYTFQGRTINAFDIGNKAYPLIFGGDAPNKTSSSSTTNAKYCYEGTLNRTLVKDKIVFCQAQTNMTGQIEAGAIGTILFDGNSDKANVCPIPASTYSRSAPILTYIRSSTTPTATIFKSDEITDKLAPFVISFSCRGPNNITRDILKPDLSAPGVEIVAAWSPLASISKLKTDKRVAEYNIISGTSMASPHATGAAAYVKSFHSTWSPAAIKSALMTTAKTMTSGKNSEAELAYGSGNIDPTRARDPGLVYNASEVDYVRFLCGQGYSDTSLRAVTGDMTSTCSSTVKESAWNLNYPSMALSVSSNSAQTLNRVFNRVVTNVGPSMSTYTATVAGAPAGVTIAVKPTTLKFTTTGQSLPFTVEVTGTIAGQPKIVSASLVWDDGVHKVRSPIVVYNLPK